MEAETGEKDYYDEITFFNVQILFLG